MLGDPNAGRALQDETLKSIAIELDHVGLGNDGKHVWGLSSEPDGLYLVGCDTVETSESGGIVSGRAKVISYIDEEQDYAVLYLIPLLPDDNDRLGIEVFIERIKTQVVVGLQRNPAEEVELDVEKMISHTIPVWDRWDNNDSRKYVRRRTRDIARDYLGRLASECNIKVETDPSGTIRVSNLTRETRRDLLAVIKSLLFQRYRPEIDMRQITIDDLDEAGPGEGETLG